VEVTACVQFPGAGAGEVSWLILSDQQEDGAEAQDIGLDDRDRPSPMTQALTRLAMLTQQSLGRTEILHEAATLCADGLGRGAEVSVSVGSPLEPDETVSTSLEAQTWDGAQLRAGQGPSETAFRQGVTTSTPDVRSDERWPRLATATAEGTWAVLAAPLRSGEMVVGALTAYVPTVTATLVDQLELFAVTLGGVLHELALQDDLRRLESDMQRALTSRAVIDQAKGIIMADRRIDAEQAWRHLVTLSSTHHVKVRDVAEEIVARASGQG
jgi:hypothetical protein